MNSSLDIYGKRRTGGHHGDVYTSPEVVSFMLDLVGYTSDKDLSTIRVLEPSFGNGEFLLEIFNRIVQSSKLHNFTASEVFSENVYGCELDREKHSATVRFFTNHVEDYNPKNLKNEDFLFSDWDIEFDIVVGNPPYVRYENIPIETRNRYKAKFRSFHYRPDLYILFYEHSLNLLSKDGKHCFICANRWLKNEYGKVLRNIISKSFRLETIIDMESVQAFQEEVLAYPAITVVTYSQNEYCVNMADIDCLPQLNANLPFVPKRYTNDECWDELFLDGNIKELKTIEQQGFSIGIGVATGADKIFISDKFPGNVEEELLLPLLNAKDLSGDAFNWKGEYLLNPYSSSDGTIIDLNDFPLGKQYLEAHKTELAGRHIVKKGRIWYSLIDKVKRDLKEADKIVIPDISANKVIFVDEGNFYPAHNLYYIIGHSKTDLYLLAAILMSDFVKNQISKVSNKMNGGFPRWQSQSLRKLRVPTISDIDGSTRDLLVTAYNKRDFLGINKIVEDLITTKDRLITTPSFPTSLFDFDFSSDVQATG